VNERRNVMILWKLRKTRVLLYGTRVILRWNGSIWIIDLD
jgi:hypothetical protein